MINIIIAIVIVVVAVLFFILGAYVIWKVADDALKSQDEQNVRATAYYNVLNQWLKDINEGKDISDYFVRNGWKTIAIYGYAELGMRLHECLKCSKKVSVSYIIDQNAQNVASELNVYKPSKDLPNVDVIVITPVHVYSIVDKMLKNMVSYKIVSLEDVIYDI